MKYLSLDIETTSLEPSTNNILQISAVVEDTSLENLPTVEMLPHFTCFVRPFLVTGQPYALAMNAWILDIIAGRASNTKEYPIYDAQNWVPDLLAFIKHHFQEDRPTIAGKNVAGFDLQFMPKAITDKLSHRTIDPAMLYMDWKTDKRPPSLHQKPF